MKRALILETSGPLGGLALVQYQMPLGAAENNTFREWRRENSHSEVVTQYVRKALEESGWKIEDFDCFAVGVGPGSFTGIRVALNVIRTLAYSTDKPVYCFSSLKALALSTSHQDLPIVTLTNAYKNMVYGARYRWTKSQELVEEVSPTAWTLDKLGGLVEESSLCVGDGLAAYKDMIPKEIIDRLVRDEHQPDDPRIAIFAPRLISDLRPEDLQPWKTAKALYIHASEAEEKLRSGLLKPLPKI